MALDGTVISALAHEIDRALSGGRISKIAMPEKDELLITVKNNSENYRLLISAGAALPLVYLTDENKPSPMTAPGFCMLLRKYIGSGRILSVRQQGLERILIIDLEHRDDMGDLCRKSLIVELMGKYSNIIFTDDKSMILDSIRHVPAHMSSLREVLPGRDYYLPEELTKTDPLTTDRESFLSLVKSSAGPVQKNVYLTFAGISPIVSSELCFRAGLDGDKTRDLVTEAEWNRLADIWTDFTDTLKDGRFEPALISRKGEPQEFTVIRLTCLESEKYEKTPYDSVSLLLRDFYSSREKISHMRQRSSDLRRLVNTALERSARKLSLQEKQLKDSAGKDRYRVYGDLIRTYMYTLSGGEKVLECENYYDDGKLISIPLDENKSAADNATRYYDRYQKLRRTEIALSEEIKKTQADTDHLASILASLDMASDESDLSQIRDELVEFGYIKKHAVSGKGSTKKPVYKPLHYMSSDGFHIYVGKNNYQNEEVSFKIASGNDWWFHAKGIPGSHVVVKGEGRELPDRVYEEAAALAAYYSKGRDQGRVEIDYTQKKNLHKVAGAAPGFVIYHTNYSMTAAPSAALKELP